MKTLFTFALLLLLALQTQSHAQQPVALGEFWSGISYHPYYHAGHYYDHYDDYDIYVVPRYRGYGHGSYGGYRDYYRPIYRHEFGIERNLMGW